MISIIPQSRVRRDNINNLQCMCKNCNRSKKNDVGFDTVKDYTRNSIDNYSRDVKKTLNSLFTKFK